MLKDRIEKKNINLKNDKNTKAITGQPPKIVLFSKTFNP
jgi:hypothetical protein